MHLCNFLVLVKRKKRPFTWVVFFLPAHVYPSFSLLKPEISQKLYMIFKLIGVNRFSIYILIWPPVNLYLAPPPPQKTVNLGQWTQMWVGGVGWCYKSMFLWHIWPIFVENHGKCPKSYEISEIEGVGGWVHKFGSIVPNLPIFWYGIDPIYQSQRMFSSSSVQLYN